MATPAAPLLQTGAGNNWLEPGFTNDSVTSYLFKKALSRANTGADQPYYREASAKPTFFRDSLATDNIPKEPPGDFVTLSNAQIKVQFGVSDAELDALSVRSDGTNVFSIEQSAGYPHIYRINYLKLTPHPSNPAVAFRSLTASSRVNFLQNTIPFTYGNGGYRGIIYRTDREGNLSAGGRDTVLSQQVAYVYDYDVGLFTLHESDVKPYTTNPVGVLNPPAISCYVYRGTFGRFGWSYLAPDSLVLDEMRLLVGRRDIGDPTLVMDVSGSAFITDVFAHSYNTISDMRLKTNIRNVSVSPGLLHVEPRTYNYVSDAEGAPPEFGVMAQEVEAVMPELVRTNPEGFKSVMYDRVGVALLPLVRHQEARIAALERENAEMRGLLMTIAAKLKL